MPFKVIQDHRCRYQSKARYDFLLVINTYRHAISCHFEVIVDYCSNFEYFACLSPLRRVEVTYAVHLSLIGKLVDFLFVLIELFSLDYITN